MLIVGIGAEPRLPRRRLLDGQLVVPALNVLDQGMPCDHDSEHVDHLPELVDRAVYIPPLAGDLHLGLVHEPAVADGVPARSGSLGQQRREPLPRR
jgi:hypothetical protein